MLFVMVSMASAGVPGFANFIGEMMILLGAWDKYRIPAIGAVAGLVITAGYMLKTVRSTIQGPLDPRWQKLHDAHGIERLPYLFLITILVVVGCFPGLLLPTISSATQGILR